MNDKEKIARVRNTVCQASTGNTLEEFMLGTIMAQGTVIGSLVRDPAEARQLAEHYHALLVEALPFYCEEFGGADRLLN